MSVLDCGIDTYESKDDNVLFSRSLTPPAIGAHG